MKDDLKKLRAELNKSRKLVKDLEFQNAILKYKISNLQEYIIKNQ